MPVQKKNTSVCLLVTGIGHSGTRLVVDMLSKHPDVEVPEMLLNKVKEYSPLHQFFIETIDKTPLSSSKYSVDDQELHFILDSYMSCVQKTKKYFLLKMPFYPMFCLDKIERYFKKKLKCLFVTRPIKKIVDSYNRRNEVTRYFTNRKEQFRQIKKLDVNRRAYHLAMSNSDMFDVEAYFADLFEHATILKSEWNKRRSPASFIDIDIESFAVSHDEFNNFLARLSLSPEYTDSIMKTINRKRLLGNFIQNVKGRLKDVIRPYLRKGNA